MSFGIHKIFVNTSSRKLETQSVQVPCASSCPRSEKRIVCYTPKNSSGVVSCTLNKNSERATIITDKNLALIPKNAIIDSIEFF
jgi:hypothetical protein